MLRKSDSPSREDVGGAHVDKVSAKPGQRYTARMWGHDLVAGFAGLVLSFVAPLANPAFVAPAYSSSNYNYGYGSSGSVDCTLTVSQSGVSAGTAAQVTWTTSGASTATMSQDGSPAVSVALSGSVPVTITHNTSLSLTARNGYGAYKTCTATVTVSTNSSTPSCGLSPTPGVHYAGQQLQLVWYTQNATAAQISNVGAVPSNQLIQGSITIAPAYTTLYTMTVSNPSGSRTCSALVSINQRPTTNYQPVTTQQVTYRPTTSGTPSYSSPRSYPTYTYPSSSGSSYSAGRGLGYGSYGGGSSYERWGSGDYWNSPSYSNGLGDWTLTNTWNNLGTGEGIFTSHDCYYGECNANPYEWGYSLQQTDGSYANQYGISDGLGYGASVTWDDSGNLLRYGSTPSDAEIQVIDNDPTWRSTTQFDVHPDGGGISSNPSWSLGGDQQEAIPGISVDNSGRFDTGQGSWNGFGTNDPLNGYLTVNSADSDNSGSYTSGFGYTPSDVGGIYLDTNSSSGGYFQNSFNNLDSSYDPLNGYLTPSVLDNSDYYDNSAVDTSWYSWGRNDI